MVKIAQAFLLFQKKCWSQPNICLNPLHQLVVKGKKGSVTATKETSKDTLCQHSDSYYSFDSFLSYFII